MNIITYQKLNSLERRADQKWSEYVFYSVKNNDYQAALAQAAFKLLKAEIHAIEN